MGKVVDMSVSDKKASSPSNNTAAHEADNNSKMTVSSRNHEKDLNRPFSGTDRVGSTSNRGETVGPTKRHSSGANEVLLGSIKRDDVFESLGGVLADEKLLRADLQPFDIFVPASYITTTTPYQSPGMGFPFTHTQWQELNRQAMIYKYMISSVPVPHNLLFPSRNAVDSSASSIHSLKYPRNGSDPEPGRCKRTDGKKWRCSRDVAPQQKYCERHLHRGRPRSRKRVEAKISSSNTIDETNKKTRLHQQNVATLPKSARNYSSQQQQLVGANEDTRSLLFSARTDLTTPSSYKGPAHRNLGLMMMTGAENTVEEPNIESGNMGLSMYGSNGLMLHNHDYYYMEQQHQNHSLDLLSHFKYLTSEIESPVGLIEAWPIDHSSNTSNNVSHKEPSLSPPDHETISSALTLSMAMSFGDALDYGEMGKIQVENDVNNHYDYPKMSMGPNSWEPFALGGPLAEALQPGSLVTLGCSDPSSPPHDSSQVATTASSPSGVLHRTLFSHSDNSACNSPTLAAAQPSEIAFRWLN